MDKSIIADNKPVHVELTKGVEYYYCTCGLSKTQPFCDGSHVITDSTPTAFTAKQSTGYFLCACKHTGNAPYCDGTHVQFTADQIGTTGDDDDAETDKPPATVAASISVSSTCVMPGFSLYSRTQLAGHRRLCLQLKYGLL